MTEQDHRIQSPELAHHMGYAEHPYRVLAAHAIKAGLQEVHDHTLQLGEVAASNAGQEYISLLQNNLELSRNNILDTGETLPQANADTDKISAEKLSGLRVTQADLHEFARHLNEDPDTRRIDSRGLDKNKKRASTLWISLEALLRDFDGNPAHSYYGRGQRENPIIQIELDAEKHETDTYSTVMSYSIDSLINLVEEFDKLKAHNPSLPASAILGRGFGDTKIEFLRNFLEYKKTQLVEQSAQ